MIPIIHYLLQFQCQIFIAATGPQKKLLEAEFPSLKYLEPPEYAVKYNSKQKSLVFGLIRQIPRLIRVIHHEREWVDQIVTKYGIDAIISDNRYGFRNSATRSIIISHQLAPKSGISKLIDNIIKLIHVRILQQFDACWIPDAEGGILSGELSCSELLPARCSYIGPISRFAGGDQRQRTDGSILIIISGPEPSRTFWENKILAQLRDYKGSYALVRGLPGEAASIPNAFNHLPAEALKALISRADLIICRSGYTSVMDLAALYKPAVLVPTPGQTEQEYLAQELSAKNYFLTMQEQAFSLEEAIHRSKSFSSSLPSLDFERFKWFIDELLLHLNKIR